MDKGPSQDHAVGRSLATDDRPPLDKLGALSLSNGPAGFLQPHTDRFASARENCGQLHDPVSPMPTLPDLAIVMRDGLACEEGATDRFSRNPEGPAAELLPAARVSPKAARWETKRG